MIDREIDKLPNDAVLSIAEVVALSGLSRDTFDRMHKRSMGPPRVRLSARRVGYRLGQFREWLKQRAEPFA
jgi:predicted DNA-binding transcriptional regulator AlpA